MDERFGGGRGEKRGRREEESSGRSQERESCLSLALGFQEGKSS